MTNHSDNEDFAQNAASNAPTEMSMETAETKALPASVLPAEVDRRKGERRGTGERRDGLRGLWDDRRLYDRRRREYSIFGNKLGDETELPSRDVVLNEDEAASAAPQAPAPQKSQPQNELVWEPLDEEATTISPEKMRNAAKREKNAERNGW